MGVYSHRVRANLKRRKALTLSGNGYKMAVPRNVYYLNLIRTAISDFNVALWVSTPPFAKGGVFVSTVSGGALAKSEEYFENLIPPRTRFLKFAHQASFQGSFQVWRWTKMFRTSDCRKF